MAKNSELIQELLDRSIRDAQQSGKFILYGNQHVNQHSAGFGAAAQVQETPAIFVRFIKAMLGSELQNLRELDCTAFEFQVHEAQAFTQAMKSGSCPKLTILKLSHSNKGGTSHVDRSADKGLSIIVESMLQGVFAGLKELYFFEADTSFSTVDNYHNHNMILYAVQERACHQLVKLDLGLQHSIDDQSIMPILALLQSKACRDLQSLKFKPKVGHLSKLLWNGFLGFMIDQAVINHVLDFGNFRVNMEYLADVMKSGILSRLIHLNLEGCKIGYNGTKQLHGAFELNVCPELNICNLKDNDIGNDGAAILFVAFKKGVLSKLTQLDLAGNNIDFDGLDKIYTFLQDRQSAIEPGQPGKSIDHAQPQLEQFVQIEGESSASASSSFSAPALGEPRHCDSLDLQ